VDSVVDEVGDAMREHTGLAGPGAGDHEQWPRFVGDGVELVGVQAFGERRRPVPRERIAKRVR
jgi:hypothetical protein